MKPTGLMNPDKPCSLLTACLLFVCRWNVNETLAPSQVQPRASVDLTRLKQQPLDGHAFLASTSAHARARQQPEKGASACLLSSRRFADTVCK